MILRQARPAEFLVRFCPLQYYRLIESYMNRPGSPGQARVRGSATALV